ncbi:hypothetical protein KIN20_027683 [Parelaphostrongylus tenuis]|uniref:CWH43-like N-terminal domain-containing protein n=1 Tax=Parelaphostrongylus tenuis TaxID=148309 RepID=A0AAD5R008_PARTN|nr:hypothetical protein KIN20_027683 [Parelaphostrongylus tenuis]
MGALLPGFGCYFCIAYTYIFQYDIIANFTENNKCPGVHSDLPPVSYAIGMWTPQRYIWLIVMFLHCPPRIFFLILYQRAFRKSAPKSVFYHRVIYFYSKTMWIELFGLIAVSVFDIKFSFVVHAIAYSIWIISFNFNMFFNTILHHFGGIRQKSKKSEVIWRIKLTMFISGSLLSLSTAVSYPLFLAHCLQEAYVAFSIAEYILVGYNSFFYCLSYWEFPRCRLTLGVYEPPKKIRCSTTTILSSNSTISNKVEVGGRLVTDSTAS